MPFRFILTCCFAIAVAVAGMACVAHAQYVIDRHPAVAVDSVGAAALRSLRVDLTRLRVAQDSFYVLHRSYTADTVALGWRPTSDAVFRITRADSTGWVAEAKHWLLLSGPEVLMIRRTGDHPRPQ
jgi:hypothetical protein